jgi:hypothetical protein
MHCGNTRIFGGEVYVFKIPVQSNLHVSEKPLLEPDSFVKNGIDPSIKDTDIELLGVKKPAGPFINSGEDTFFISLPENQTSHLFCLVQIQVLNWH